MIPKFLVDLFLVFVITLPFFAIALLMRMVHKQRELEKEGRRLIREWEEAIVEELRRK